MELAPPRGSELAAAFARTLGFHYRYSIWQMRLGSAAVVLPAAFPSDVHARPYALGADDEGFVELFNTAFVDHEPPMTVTLDSIRAAHGGPKFDPASLAIVTPLEMDTPVAFCRTFVDIDDGVRVGEVRVLGVRPDWRGRGLGRELLRWAVHHLRASGVDEVRLAVGGRNDSALRLYERTGFTRRQEWPRWVRATDGHASSDAGSNL
jgi:mycothiol synthase